MNWLPEEASNLARNVDTVIWFVTIISLVFFFLITVVLVFFAIKYRRKSGEDETPYITGNHFLETLWTIVPSILVLVIFAYGFIVFKQMRTPPQEALEVNVIGKQWLWQFQYDNGKTTINELYVQQNRPVKLIMRSEDVIHSFFVPAFRVKQDLLGGMYTYLWFTPTKVGVFDLYCAEYCGAAHSKMLGKVIVMSPEAYERWRKGEEREEQKGVASISPVQLGEQLYQQRGCNACHTIDGTPSVGPSWKGLFGHEVTLQDGTKVTADENYIRESILEPQAKLVKGYQPVMPSFKGILTDEEISAIIAYIKTLK
ncbi:MAG: cytochrome c oxidase subunit 2 [Deltaproteobacteria bacterium]|jgi:cytochrome c oxidase subunit 2|nr:MAG: cytochrome c oxidase subunit 2 [Deltaproteobacteria bacterium]